MWLLKLTHNVCVVLRARVQFKAKLQAKLQASGNAADAPSDVNPSGSVGDLFRKIVAGKTGLVLQKAEDGGVDVVDEKEPTCPTDFVRWKLPNFIEAKVDALAEAKPDLEAVNNKFEIIFVCLLILFFVFVFYFVFCFVLFCFWFICFVLFCFLFLFFNLVF